MRGNVTVSDFHSVGVRVFVDHGMSYIFWKVWPKAFKFLQICGKKIQQLFSSARKLVRRRVHGLKCLLQKISLVAESQNQSFVCPFRCLDCQNGNVPSPWDDNSGRVQGRWNKKELCTEFEQERCGALIEAGSTANAIKEHKLLQQVNLFSLSSFSKWIIE